MIMWTRCQHSWWLHGHGVSVVNNDCTDIYAKFWRPLTDFKAKIKYLGVFPCLLATFFNIWKLRVKFWYWISLSLRICCSLFMSNQGRMFKQNRKDSKIVLKGQCHEILNPFYRSKNSTWAHIKRQTWFCETFVSALLLTMPTRCQRSCPLRQHCVSIVNDYTDNMSA